MVNILLYKTLTDYGNPLRSDREPDQNLLKSPIRNK
jgi:hypothetical protein